MKTQDAISALRPLSNWTKSVEKLNEILDLVQEKESLIETSEARLSTLTQKIEEADKKYSEAQARNKEGFEKLDEELVIKRAQIERNFENRRLELASELQSLEDTMKNERESFKKSKDDFLDELVVLNNQIRDKQVELDNLAKRLQEAIFGTQKFIEEGSSSARVD